MSMRDIRRRIKSVQSTQQITKAMKMVASARLHKAQARVYQARPYAQAMRRTLRELLERTSWEQNFFFTEKTEGKVCYVVVTADRGLCGGFNANILRMVIEHAQGKDVVFYPIGKKGRDYLQFREYPMYDQGIPTGDEPDGAETLRIARLLLGGFQAGELKEVYLAYSRFESAMVQTPRLFRLLPMTPPDGEIEHKQTQFIFEPGADSVLSQLIPRFVSSQIYRAMVENKAGEYGARMAAMDSATENAQEMIRQLTLDLNRARQAAITQELAEIVGGAEALK